MSRWTLSESYRQCERVSRASSSSFYPAFVLLPRAQYRAMCALYAFLRWTDDLVDGDAVVVEKHHALAAWRSSLDAALAGETDSPLLVALADTVRRFDVPVEFLRTAIDGAEMDLTTTRYATFRDLSEYCQRVASVVGLCCLPIWGCHESQAVGPATAAGLAFQLTNILRDLGEDLVRGRVYLPEVELATFQCPPDRWTLEPDRFGELLRFQIDRARAFYQESESLRGYLAAPGRAVYGLMWSTYRSLLDAIDRAGVSVLSNRPRVDRRRKASLFLRALPTAIGWAK